MICQSDLLPESVFCTIRYFLHVAMVEVGVVVVMRTLGKGVGISLRVMYFIEHESPGWTPYITQCVGVPGTYAQEFSWEMGNWVMVQKSKYGPICIALK